MEKRAADRGGHHLARSTAADMLSGKRIPSQVVLLTFVQPAAFPPTASAPDGRPGSR
ncbi:hypothetical protein ACGFNU_13740 [Spirillospora sp. NPDC048911]|uniref:hypothetical protein n=1 Tax=Spirillospora sp. NPDC048911 TaxID=3364527 RepID=UPI00371BFA20